MPGMLTEEQFAELKKATGTDFDRAFVQYMIAHHMGALQMVEKLFNSDGGQETEIFTYASHVDGDQRIEIDRMQKLLAQLGGPARTDPPLPLPAGTRSPGAAVNFWTAACSGTNTTCGMPCASTNSSTTSTATRPWLRRLRYARSRFRSTIQSESST